ncbi:MAG: prephenate dehydrogenase [Lachnospiraceae bacterium]|nr:prephenate dehydrogenase [Lachnospiraceae bacterium]
MNFSQIGFIGLGLIGGSIAKTIQKKYSETKIIATANRQSTIDEAYSDGVIDNSVLLDIEDFSECDVIFLCSPVKYNISYLKELKNIIKPTCLVTDVGSVKGDITSAAIEIGIDNQFIGGHPMAGAESTGYNNATTTLLENAYYILTYTDKIDGSILSDFDKFISSLGAITMTMPSQKHDFAVACISHLPHIISASLVNYVNEADDDGTLKTIAAGGFRDITRISSSSPTMWQHICATNKDEILNAYKLYIESLNKFVEAVENSDEAKTFELFTNAKNYRDNLPVKNNGLIPSAFEFYLDLEDEAGNIATVATILAKENISIKNIGIVHNREFEQGVLRIETYDDKSMRDAIEILKYKYKIYK